MIAVAALASLLVAADPCGLPALRAGPLPWRPGEVLQFDLEVMGMVKAGTMSMEAGRPMFDGTQIPLKARVRNTSVFAKIRRIVGTAFSWVDSKTLLPERARDDVLEDGVKKVSDARIRGDQPAVTIETDFGGQKGSASYERQGAVLDALSAAYYLRAADLKPGQEILLRRRGAPPLLAIPRQGGREAGARRLRRGALRHAPRGGDDRARGQAGNEASALRVDLDRPQEDPGGGGERD